jgi:hypothetical protein
VDRPRRRRPGSRKLGPIGRSLPYPTRTRAVFDCFSGEQVAIEQNQIKNWQERNLFFISFLQFTCRMHQDTRLACSVFRRTDGEQPLTED